MGDALRGVVDLLADQIADGGKILRQIDVDVVDCGADLFGLPDQIAGDDVRIGGERVGQVSQVSLAPHSGTQAQATLALSSGRALDQ